MAISRAEREDVREASYRDLITAARMDLHTAMPGIIQSFDAARMTCTIQPAIRGAIIAPNGRAEAADLVAAHLQGVRGGDIPFLCTETLV